MYHKERKMFPQLNYAMPLIVKIPQVGRCENVKEKKKVVLELVKLVHTRSEPKSCWRQAKRSRIQKVFCSPGPPGSSLVPKGRSL